MSRLKERNPLTRFFEALEIMEKSIETVAVVLQRLPELVPQFSINQNPLSQILEFWKGLHNENTSLTEPQLRGDDGRFSHATTEEEEGS